MKVLKLSAFSLFIVSCGNAAIDDVTPINRPVEYVFVKAFEGEPTSQYVGRVQDALTTQLSFEVPGIIASLSVDLGDSFERGQVLGRLDMRNFNLDIERRKSAIQQAEADRLDAELDFTRKNALSGTGAISGAAIDAAKARLDAANSTVAGLRTALAQANKAKADGLLTADFAGTVLDRLVEPGRTVSAGTPILSVSERDQPLEAAFSLTQADIGSVAVGDEMQVKVTATGALINGTVTQISTTGSSSLSFPVQSLNGQSYYVYKIGDDAVARRTTVVVRELIDAGYVLSDGLAVGERIVSRGAVQVKDGETLTLIDPASTRYPE